MNWSDRARSSPSLRAKAAKGIREATRPGPKRLALLAGIGEPALPGDSAAPVAPVAVKPKRRAPARSRAVNHWKAWAATRRPEAVGTSRLVLWLPGVIYVAEMVYRWISRNRYLLSRVFGCKEACTIMPARVRANDSLSTPPTETR